MVDSAAMTQDERRLWLLEKLMAERPGCSGELPEDLEGQQSLLQDLICLRPAGSAALEYLLVEGDYLQERAREKGIIEPDELFSRGEDNARGSNASRQLTVWCGDITRLQCGALVNALHPALEGCSTPRHGCANSRIHSFAGVQLRQECARIARVYEGGLPPVGRAEISFAYNLPSACIIHVRGPELGGHLNPQDVELLRQTYQSCVSLAEAQDMPSLAFPSMSELAPGFPLMQALRTAVQAVREALQAHGSKMQIIFVAGNREEYRALATRLNA